MVPNSSRVLSGLTCLIHQCLHSMLRRNENRKGFGRNPYHPNLVDGGHQATPFLGTALCVSPGAAASEGFELEA